MPFLKSRNKIQPLWKKWEKITYKTGLRHAIFNVPGDKYIGEWKTNKKDGKGALYTRSEKLYEGDWKRGYRHGYGILSYKDPDGNYVTDYIGKWVNGKRQGGGVAHSEDGSYYEGDWYNGKREGNGRMWFEDGSYYQGQWANDTFHGLGMFVCVNGSRYEGEWSCGKKHGHGCFYHLDSGQLQEGVWEHNTVVCSTMVDIYYRQSAKEPTKYSIPECKLQDPDSVYREREESVLKKQRELANKLPIIKKMAKDLHKSDSCITS